MASSDLNTRILVYIFKRVRDDLGPEKNKRRDLPLTNVAKARQKHTPKRKSVQAMLQELRRQTVHTEGHQHCEAHGLTQRSGTVFRIFGNIFVLAIFRIWQFNLPNFISGRGSTNSTNPEQFSASFTTRPDLSVRAFQRLNYACFSAEQSGEGTRYEHGTEIGPRVLRRLLKKF